MGDKVLSAMTLHPAGPSAKRFAEVIETEAVGSRHVHTVEEAP